MGGEVREAGGWAPDSFRRTIERTSASALSKVVIRCVCSQVPLGHVCAAWPEFGNPADLRACILRVLCWEEGRNETG